MDIYYQPDIFLVSGMPENGKTSFAVGYCNEKSNTTILHADCIFSLMHHMFPEENGISEKFDIYRYINHSSFDADSFLKLFKEEFFKLSCYRNSYKSIIIEGYVCGKLYEEMKKIINDFGYKYVYSVSLLKTLKGFEILLDKTSMGIINSKSYYDIVSNIDMTLSDLKTVKKKVTYQKFPWHTKTELNSNSDIKYEVSLKEIPLFQKTFLDIGCNTGYFCFKAKEQGAKKVYGIDAAINWIELAYDINKYFYNFNDMYFSAVDVFDVILPHKIDVVFCASVFHYFKERQQEFINKMHRINTCDGILLLEVELSPRVDVDYENVIRGNDISYLTYPTRLGFMKMITDKYVVIKEALSYRQPGSVFNRTFFTLKRI